MSAIREKLKVFPVSSLFALADVFLTNVFAMFYVITVVLLFLPKLLIVFLINKEIFWKDVRRLPIHIVVIFCIFALMGANNKIAEHRSAALISAFEQYKAKYREYPQKMQDLVPEFLRKIPAAKIGLFGQFSYINYKGSHTLMYIQLPPFARAGYNFEKKAWKSMD